MKDGPRRFGYHNPRHGLASFVVRSKTDLKTTTHVVCVPTLIHLVFLQPLLSSSITALSAFRMVLPVTLARWAKTSSVLSWNVIIRWR